MAEIGVTAEQKEALTSLKEAAKTELKPLWETLCQERKALITYLARPEADESEFQAQAQEAEQLGRQLKQAYIRSIIQMKKILTSEQQRRFAERLQGKMQEFEAKCAGFKAAS
jgi:Spy/CpxP family protein refolding chaperone